MLSRCLMNRTCQGCPTFNSFAARQSILDLGNARMGAKTTRFNLRCAPLRQIETILTQKATEDMQYCSHSSNLNYLASDAGSWPILSCGTAFRPAYLRAKNQSNEQSRFSETAKAPGASAYAKCDTKIATTVQVRHLFAAKPRKLMSNLALGTSAGRQVPEAQNTGGESAPWEGQ